MGFGKSPTWNGYLQHTDIIWVSVFVIKNEDSICSHIICGVF